MTTGTFAKGKKPEGDTAGKAIAHFPEEKVIMSIYGGSAPHESQCKLKLIGQGINTIRAAILEYLCWSESLITFDWIDHPDSIPKPGRFPLIVDPLVGTTRLTKVLMYGGSGLNLMYPDTFEGLGLTHDQLQSSPHPFYIVVPGKQFIPLGWVTLPITFGDMSNYRTETWAFEVVNFSGPYHIILGWLCYLKLKIPRPIGVSTVEAKTQRALDCEQDIIELAAAVVSVAELRELSL
jgi:hypothetical protein